MGGEENNHVPEGQEGIDVSIIVISFNTRDMTIECLRSVYAETRGVSFELIVLDNNSVDGSAEAIRKEFPGIDLIKLKQNIGFAAANNFVAKRVRGRRILLLNPDTVILDRAIDHLVSFADKNPSCGLWGGRTVWGDGSLNPKSCWRRMGLWNLFCFVSGLAYIAPDNPILNSECYGGWKRDTVRCVDIVTGCLLLIDKRLWDQLGGFDPIFFMYGEEADLCLRAQRVGARPIVTPSATIVHYGGASSSSSVDRIAAVFKGKVTLMRRHWSPVNRGMGRALLLLAPLVRWWMYNLAAQVTRKPRLRQVAKDWQAVWRLRGQWLEGYSHSLRPD